MRPPHLIIRADAGPEVGTGHLMRCLALAQGWQGREGEVLFITACDNGSLTRRLEAEGIRVAKLGSAYPSASDWQTTSRVLSECPGGWVVLDGYHFHSKYQGGIRDAGHPLLVIDDTACHDYYDADIVLNQNVNAGQLRYSCRPRARLLLGPSYALLRQEFLACRGWKRRIPLRACRLLVTFGGTDRHNVTGSVIQALELLRVPGLEIRAIAGAANPHLGELRAACETLKHKAHVLTDVADMPGMMKWADLAVSAAGSTFWEMAFLGLPACTLAIAENQRELAEELGRGKLAVNLGWFDRVEPGRLASVVGDLLCDAEVRRCMSERGRSAVPGTGVESVINLMLEKAEATAI